MGKPRKTLYEDRIELEMDPTVAILFAIVGSFIPAVNAPARSSNFIIAILSMNCSRLILSIRDAVNAPLFSLHITTALDLPEFAPSTQLSEVEPAGVENSLRGIEDHVDENVNPNDHVIMQEERIEMEVMPEEGPSVS